MPVSWRQAPNGTEKKKNTQGHRSPQLPNVTETQGTDNLGACPTARKGQRFLTSFFTQNYWDS